MDSKEENSLKTGGLADYKFYCFGGKMKLLGIYSDRNSDKPTKADYFNREFEWIDIKWGYQHSDKKPDKPSKFEEMVNIAETLSKNIPELRVDLYLCNNKIYFGELTFFDGSGFDKIEPYKWDSMMGDWVII